MAYTIRKIKGKTGITFKAIIRDKEGKHLKSKNFTRRSDAEAWAKPIDADREKMEALGLRGASMTFAQLVDEYALQWKKRDQNQAYRLAYWSKELGPYKITDITGQLLRQKLKDFQNGHCLRGDGMNKSKELQKTRSPATVNRHRGTLGGVFKFALQEGYINSNPLQKTTCLEVNNDRVRYLSDAERERLFDACKQSAWPRLYTLVLMATCTGMRKSEMLNLKWCDIDFDQGLAFLALTKNGQPRVCPIPTPALNELKKIRGFGNTLAFPSTTMPDQPMEFKRHWHKALKEAAIEDFRFHDLRHTAASYLVMNGASLHEAGEILGHRDLSTTRRYSHLSTEYKHSVAERVMTKIIS
jgi:integrase